MREGLGTSGPENVPCCEQWLQIHGHIKLVNCAKCSHNPSKDAADWSVVADFKSILNFKKSFLKIWLSQASLFVDMETWEYYGDFRCSTLGAGHLKATSRIVRNHPCEYSDWRQRIQLLYNQTCVINWLTNYSQTCVINWLTNYSQTCVIGWLTNYSQTCVIGWPLLWRKYSMYLLVLHCGWVFRLFF